jgi:hypothetical protein
MIQIALHRGLSGNIACSDVMQGEQDQTSHGWQDKGARCAAVGREIFQKLSARYWFGGTLQESEFSLSLKKSAQCVDGTDPNSASWCAARNDVPPSGLGKPGAGPTGARQGSRYARPALPAGGLDRHRLARRLTAMR